MKETVNENVCLEQGILPFKIIVFQWTEKKKIIYFLLRAKIEILSSFNLALYE